MLTAEARLTRTLRTVGREVRALFGALATIAAWFLMAFLAGSFVGAFIFGVLWVARMAP